jgi:hypothetical protein
MTLLSRVSYGLPTIPQPDRLGLLIAYDESRRELWAFGGFDPDTLAPLGELWRWRISEPALGWIRVDPLGAKPSARSDSIWVYDSSRFVFYLVGGVDSDFSFLQDTWKFDPGTVTWTNQSPTGTLAQRYPQQGVYDRARDRVVRFGGADTGFLPQQDTQEYDPSGNVWSEPTFSAALPPVRFSHGMAYDQTRSLVVVHGGVTTGAVELSDTWVYPVAGEWSQQTSPLAPVARHSHILEYHPRLRGVFAALGTNIVSAFTDAWILTSDGWRETHPLSPPIARDISYGTRVDALGGVAIHGGQDQANTPFGPLVDTQLFGSDEEWSIPQIGFSYDRAEIELDGGVRLVDPSSAASSRVRFLAGLMVQSPITSWDLFSTVPTNSRILVVLFLDGAPLYWDGSAWATSDLTTAQLSTPADVSANIGSLTIATGGQLLTWELGLFSDDSIANPEAEQVEIVAEPGFVAANICEVSGIVDGRREGVVVRALYPSTGFYIGDEFVPANMVFRTTSDSNGEFRLSIPETETTGTTVTIEILAMVRGTLQTQTFAGKTIPNQNAISIEDL